MKEPENRCQPFLPKIEREVVHIEVDVVLHHRRVHLLAVHPAIAHHFFRMSIGVLHAFSYACFDPQQEVTAERTPAEYPAKGYGQARMLLPPGAEVEQLFQLVAADR